MSETSQPVFSIEKVYVKDLSLELPNAPQIFLEREQPAVEVGLQSEANGLGDGIFVGMKALFYGFLRIVFASCWDHENRIHGSIGFTD